MRSMMFRRVCATLLAAIGCLALAGPSAGDCIDYSQYLHVERNIYTNGGARGIAMSGNLAVVAEQLGCGDSDHGPPSYCFGRLELIEFPPGGEPAIVGSIDLGGPAIGVAVSGRYACVLRQYGGLDVVDLSNPATPSVVGHVAIPGYHKNVAVDGSYAYVANGAWGLSVVDISNPHLPQFQGSVDTPGGALHVAILGTHAYVADGVNGLQVVDISNPTSPSIVGVVDTPGWASAVVIAGAYAVVADGTSGVQIADISNPDAPVIVGSALLDGRAAASVAVDGTRAYVCTDADLSVVDFTNPALPVVVGKVVAFGVSVTVAGARALMAWDHVTLVDISNPASPAIIGGVDTPDLASDVAVAGIYAYVADRYSGLQVVDASNPTSPRITGSVGVVGDSRSVAVSGNYAYVTSWSYPPRFGEAGLWVVDILNPLAPQIVGGLPVAGLGRDVAISGHHAYLAASTSVEVVDVSDPAAPTLVGSVPTRGHSNPGNAIVVAGGHAFVADGEAGLTVVDITNPAAPVIAGQLKIFNFSAVDVAVSGDHAFVTGGYSLAVVDISDPTLPALVGMIGFHWYVSRVSVSGSYAYVSVNTAEGSLEVVDISVPAAPTKVASFETTSMVPGLAVGADIVYLANGTAGLTLLPVQCQATTAMNLEFTPGALNLASHSFRVTGYLEPPLPVAAADIDVASIRLNGTVPVDPAAPTALGDHDGNGVPDLMVKFNRLAVELTVAEGDDVPVTVAGTVDGEPFSGTDHIRVRRATVSAPAAGSRLMAGGVTEVRWQIPDAVVAQSATLMFSPDGGGTWSLIEGGQTNTGSYAWRVPDLPTDQAKVAVVLVESADAGGDVVEGVLGVSEAFSIGAVLGVGDHGPVPLALAIRVASPSPSGDGRLRVELALRDGSPARVELVDVAGRVVISRQVGSLGPGSHSIDLSQGGALRAGIYFLRLAQGGNEVRARATVLR